VSRRAAALLVALAVVVLLATYWLFRRPAPAPSSLPPEPVVETAPPAAPERWTARLHLPAAGGRLAVVEREVASAPDAAARLEIAVTTLLEATPEPPQAAVFPAPVVLRKSLLAGDGTAYVDLALAGGGEPPPAGSTEELQRVFAVVHTVLDSVPEANRVVLLWNGVQRRSLAGHVDTGHPLVRFAALEAAAPAADEAR
jgi:hypothetical protein